MSQPSQNDLPVQGAQLSCSLISHDMKGEVGQVLQDPTAAVNIAFGPPFSDLSPQDPSTGLHLGSLCEPDPKRLVFKKAHFSQEDFRIFDQASGQLVCVSHHHGKNPYESLDPLDMGYADSMAPGSGMELEARCYVTGYMGMPSFKIRPKTLSVHGRQVALDLDTREVLFSVAKKSRLKSMNLRHNLLVDIGQDEQGKKAYEVEADLMGRTLTFKNKAGETVAFASKSSKALILSQIGAGSEMVIDVAPGVDWTAICGIMMGIQQVGAHYAKDLFKMLVNPVQDAVVGSVVDNIAGGDDEEEWGGGGWDGEEEEEEEEEEESPDEDYGDYGDYGDE